METLPPRFPRIIHQTYKTNALPEHWKESPEKWKHYHPSYEYKFWTDEDNLRLITEHFSWFLPTYEGFKYNIQRVDAVRSFILYKYGGIYADLDVVPRKTFETFLTFVENSRTEAQIILPETENPWGNYKLTNWLMVSKPAADVWKVYWEWMSRKQWQISMPWYVHWLMVSKYYTVILFNGTGRLVTGNEQRPGKNLRFSLTVLVTSENKGRETQEGWW